MTSAKKAYLALYLGISALVGSLFCFLYTPGGGQSVPIWLRLIATVAAIPAGFIGALIGDFIRRLTIPDAIFTTQGLWGILKTKLFWFCVPQLVGLFVGIAVVAGQILPKYQGAAVPMATAPTLPRLAPGEWVDAEAVIAMIPDAKVQTSLADITVLTYLSGQGRGALATTMTGNRYMILATVNGNSGATCEVAGPLDQSMSLRDGECVVSLLRSPQDDMRTIQSRTCADFCGMGGSFDGQYAVLSTISLQAGPLGPDGKRTYRPR